jgi:hypothetical protein
MATIVPHEADSLVPSQLHAWSEIVALVDQGSQSFAAVNYNLRNAAPIARTIGASVERIDANTTSPKRCETASIVYHVIEGAGATQIGERKLQWQRGDTFAIPPSLPYVHSASEKAYLFRFDDRPLLESLGTYSAAELEFPEADLRTHAPRSPHEDLGGLALLPRTIDKTKAKIQGTLGPYKVTPGLSGYLLEHLGVGEDEFTEAVRKLRDDQKILDWVRTKCDPAKFPEISQKLRTRVIRDDEHRKQFVPRYPFLEERRDLVNFFDIVAYDDSIIF